MPMKKSFSRRRAAAYIVGGAAAISIASWCPALFFRWHFQMTIEAIDPRIGLGAILRAAATPVAEAAEEGRGGAAAGAPWDRILLGGVLLPLPPGELRGISEENGVLAIEYAEGRATVTPLPADTIRATYKCERRQFSPAGNPIVGDELEILLRIVTAAPGDFRLSMGAEARGDYAAAILSKALLLGGADLERSRGIRIRTLRTPEAGKGAVLVEGSSAFRALAVSPRGTFVYAFPGAPPPAWTADPRRWAEVVPADGEELARWRAAALSLPPAHPLRKRAEAAAPERPRS
jgi:hypothetical protein